MTQHLHATYVPGCYRCELSRDEVRHQPAATRLEQIVRAVSVQYQRKGAPPTVREIGAVVGLRSSSTVNRYLHQAVEMGLVRQLPGSHSYLPVTPGRCALCGHWLATAESA